MKNKKQKGQINFFFQKTRHNILSHFTCKVKELLDIILENNKNTKSFFCSVHLHIQEKKVLYTS